MLRSPTFFLYSCLLLLLMGLFSETAVRPVAADDDEWRARYWNNDDLDGDPVLTRDEDDLDYDWGDGSPHDRVNSNNFSARWTRDVYFAPGTYRFVATMDDGMRVWVDDQLIIDAWYDSQAHDVVADVFLSEGKDHRIKVEYYEAGGQAVARLVWFPQPSGVQIFNNWRAEYFNNMVLTGAPAIVRDDATINFDWGIASPAPGFVRADQFSVRWTRTANLNAGRYRFTARSDDGVRVWVNDQLVINAWREQAGATNTGLVDIIGGPTEIRVEYFENQGGALIHVFWESLGGGASIVNWRGEYYNNAGLSGTPTFIRDDGAIDFDWGAGSPAPGVVNSNYFSARWTRSLDLNPGLHRFIATTDDGVRLWVNDTLIIDEWYDHTTQTFTAEIELPGGPTPVRMEYFEGAGTARARLTWFQIGADAGAGLTAPALPSTAGGLPAAQMTGAIHLSVRPEPSLDNEPFAFLSRNQVVPVLGRDRFGIWVKIRLPGAEEGWVSGRFLTLSVPLNDLPVVD